MLFDVMMRRTSRLPYRHGVNLAIIPVLSRSQTDRADGESQRSNGLDHETARSGLDNGHHGSPTSQDSDMGHLC